MEPEVLEILASMSRVELALYVKQGGELPGMLMDRLRSTAPESIRWYQPGQPLGDVFQHSQPVRPPTAEPLPPAPPAKSKRGPTGKAYRPRPDDGPPVESIGPGGPLRYRSVGVAARRLKIDPDELLHAALAQGTRIRGRTWRIVRDVAA